MPLLPRRSKPPVTGLFVCGWVVAVGGVFRVRVLTARARSAAVTEADRPHGPAPAGRPARVACAPPTDRSPRSNARGISRSLANPETNLEEMFNVRHELLTVRTLASHCAEVLSRMRWLRRGDITADDDDLLADLEDLFRRIHRMTDGEQEFLAGVLPLHRCRSGHALWDLCGRYPAPREAR